MPAHERMHPSGRLRFRASARARGSLPRHVADRSAVPWDSIVPAHAGQIEIEVGCGKGTFLAEAARQQPEVFFVGIEASPSYAAQSEHRLTDRGCTNAAVVADDGRLFFADTVPPGSVAKVHIYHPDPWPKRRHRKRRLFDRQFARLVATALAPGGKLLVATDNTRYFGEILATLGSAERLRRSRETELHYGDEVAGVAFGPTNFSQKYRAEERPRHRAVYARTERASIRETSMTQAENSAWTRVAALDGVPTDEGLPVECEGKELVLFRTDDGIACLEDSCPHRGAALSEGKVRDGEIICPWHGWRFVLDSGECSTLPGSMPAKTFTVRVESNEIFVKLG